MFSAVVTNSLRRYALAATQTRFASTFRKPRVYKREKISMWAYLPPIVVIVVGSRLYFDIYQMFDCCDKLKCEEIVLVSRVWKHVAIPISKIIATDENIKAIFGEHAMFQPKRLRMNATMQFGVFAHPMTGQWLHNLLYYVPDVSVHLPISGDKAAGTVTFHCTSAPYKKEWNTVNFSATVGKTPEEMAGPRKKTQFIPDFAETWYPEKNKKKYNYK